MGQTRFVVEVRESVPEGRVGEAAASIAARFAMDVKRVRKLLEDRTGPVTKPLSRDKADRVAEVFRDAGVMVAVRPGQASGGAAPFAAPGAPTSAAPDAGGQEAGAGATPESGAPAPPRTPVSVAPPPVSEGPEGVVPGGAGPVEATGDLRLSSTRWLHSPHEESGIEGWKEEVLSGAAAPEDEASGEGVPDDAAGAPAARPESATAASLPGLRVLSRMRLRGYLLVALAVAVVLLLALQLAGRRPPSAQPSPSAGVDAGMTAYTAGDFARARRLWMPLAENGEARAQYMLGYMAEHGQGRAWSNHDAADWYRRAADQRYPQAQVALGQLYRRGMGVARDARKAAELFGAAAQEGYGPGQFQYALAFFRGDGVAQDFPAALKWFQAAAASGVAEARPYVAFAGTARKGAAQPAGRSQATGAPGTEAASSAPATGASR